MYEVWAKFPLNERGRMIREWLSAPDPSVNFQKALKLREPNTGLWMLENDLYKKWKDEASFIWLHGIPGCGKTILSSTLLESLIQHATNIPNTAVAYFYFDFRDPQKQDPELMIRSLISQLLQQCVTIPLYLYELYSSCYWMDRERRRPPLFVLLKALRQLIEDIPCTYVIVDALDECENRTELMSIIEEMYTWQLQGLHVLLTSRRADDIKSTLEHVLDNNNIICIPKEAVDHDIQLYVRQRLSNEASLQEWQADTDIKQQIESSLMKGAHGIFGWVVCQLDNLGRCRNREQLFEILADLPPNLDETYNRILSAIKKRDVSFIIRILRWLAFSSRPLTLAEVAEVAAIDADRCPAFDRNEVLQNPLDFLSICSGLVTVVDLDEIYGSKEHEIYISKRHEIHIPKRQDGKSPGDHFVHPGPVVILAHYSVKEYLVSERILESTAKIYGLEPALCHRFISKCCVEYLLQFDKPGALTPTNLHCFALAKYSAQAWTDNVEKITNMDVEMVNSITELLNVEGEPFLTSIRLFDPDRWYYSEPLLGAKIPMTPSPLYYASRAGLVDVARRLLAETNTDVNALEGRFGDALRVASYYGHIEVVRLLVEKGANINTECRQAGVDFLNPLSAALRHGHFNVVQFLVDKGADINAPPGLFASALEAASCYGYLDIVQFLVEKGANINEYGRSRGGALRMASQCGHLNIVQFLAEKGADVNKKGDNKSGTALYTASLNGYIDIVGLLVEKGADVNVQSGKFGSALVAASSRGHLEVVKFLLEKGADVNCVREHSHNPLWVALTHKQPDIAQLLVERGAYVTVRYVGRGRTPSTYALNMASCIGGIALIELLVEKGADVNAQGGPFGYSLQGAAFNGDLDVVKFLINKGADVNAQGGTFGDALQAASAKGDLGIIKFLVERGADVNVQGGKFGNALHAASLNGDLGVVKCLVEKGASIHARGGEFGHALQAASSEGHLEIVKFLVKNGADVNVHSGKFGHALQAASAKGDLDTVKFLIEESANVNAQGGEYCNALQAASNNGHLDVVQLLVQNGSHINALSEKFGYALEAASSKGHLGIVTFLIENGADVNACGEENFTALHAASISCHLNVVQLLVERGANVNAQCTDEDGINALYAASSQSSDITMIEFLVEKGADVNMKGGRYGCALQAASMRGYLNMVKLLVEKGADVNLHGGKYGYALQAASAKQQSHVVEYLVEKGADVNAQGGKFGHALQAASSKSCLDIVKFLVEKGADVNAQGGKFGNAMQATLDHEDNYICDPEGTVAQFLLEKGAHTYPGETKSADIDSE